MQKLNNELCGLLNHYSQEKHSDTPDYILAEYLLDCLNAYNTALQKREKWYGRTIGEKHHIHHIDPKQTPSTEA